MIKYAIPILLPLWLCYACGNDQESESPQSVDWAKRSVESSRLDSLNEGSTYLSVYSEIYSQNEHRTHDLTATISMRNLNLKDTVFIRRADYFDTGGKSIRRYLDQPIYIAPMETVEIIIAETDKAGGTGANFLFDWSVKKNAEAPFFEAVMISTSSQQGLSFTTQGREIHLND